MLNFTRGQRNGLIVLSFLIVGFALFPIVSDYFKTDYSSSFSEFEKEINQARVVELEDTHSSDIPKIESFEFDPNLIDELGMQRLGLSEKQIKQILNYRNKKGHFYKKEDFGKIYAIDDETYNRLENYIVMATKEKQRAYKNNKKFKKEYTAKAKYKKVFVEINSASVEDLQTIRGIGEAFSKRIIKYRNNLGGFVQKEQLLEVYGIDDEKYSQIHDQIGVDSKKAKRIRVNFESAKIFEIHPYFSKKQAKEIAKNKTFNGRYKSVDDFRERLNFSQEFINKVQDYLEF